MSISSESYSEISSCQPSKTGPSSVSSSSSNLMIYSLSPSENSMSSPSFLTIIPSSGLIALNIFKTSESLAEDMSTTSSSSSSEKSPPISSMFILSVSSESKESISLAGSSSDGSTSESSLSRPSSSPVSSGTSSVVFSLGSGCSSTSFSSSSIDSFNKSFSSCFMVEASIPFAFAFTASSRVCT